ncbi:MAG: hypothetical protein IKQ92_12465 [Clostridia bacterium]|nr:hypothetical protein [Clostridia bacterium]
MKQKLKALICLLLAALLVGCSAAENGSETESGKESAVNTEAELPADETTDPAAAPENEEEVTDGTDGTAATGLIPKGRTAKTVCRVPEPSSYSDKLTVASLEGLAARLSDDQILIQGGGAFELYLPYLKSEWGAEVGSRIGGKAASLKNLLEHYTDIVKGYVLCSSDSSSPSVSVAISVAGLLDAVVVTPENVSVAEKAGYTCLLDATDKNDRWLRSSEYFDRLNRKVAFEQPSSMAPKLVDYAVMCGAYFGFYDGHTKQGHTAQYRFLEPGAVVFGYNNTLGERETVQSFSSLNVQMVPADHAYNLSTLSGFPLDSITQKRSEETVSETPAAVHTVTFLMSDGDNIQWVLNNFATSSEWFGSKKRGKFPMGWGISPSSVDVMPPMLSYLYDAMTEKDEFVMQLSGVGYTFPSRWDAEARREMTAEVARRMRRLDLHYAEILDDGGFTEEVMADYTAEDAIDGLFYIDYSHYAGMKGKIIWTNGKPAVSARYYMWADKPDGQLSYIARKVNAAPTDPTDENSYSFIILNVWSGLNGGKLVAHGNTMDAVAELIGQFGDQVEVVSPTVFMDRLIANCGK